MEIIFEQKKGKNRCFFESQFAMYHVVMRALFETFRSNCNFFTQ